MNRLWVVECQFKDWNEWCICDFADHEFTFTNFYDAHKEKRIIQEYLHREGSINWRKKDFRVREYVRVKK